MLSFRILVGALALTCFGLFDAAAVDAAKYPSAMRLHIRQGTGPSSTSSRDVVVVVKAGAIDLAGSTVVIDGLKVTVDGTETAACRQQARRRRAVAVRANRVQAGSVATVTLLDAKGNSVAAFSGSVGSDGVLALVPDKGNPLDIAVVRAEVSVETPEFSKFGWDYSSLTIEGGNIEYANSARLTITSKSAVVDPACASKAGCVAPVVKGGAGAAVDVTDLKFGEVEDEWACAIGTPIVSVGEVKVKAYGANSKGNLGVVDTAKVHMGDAWDDGRFGVNPLPTDEDPLTMMVLLPLSKSNLYFGRQIAVVSSGWDPTSTLPTHGEIEVDGGQTVVVPVHSYQVAGAAALEVKGDPTGYLYDVTVDGVVYKGAMRLGPHRWTHIALTHQLSVIKVEGGNFILHDTSVITMGKQQPSNVVISFAPVAGLKGEGAGPAIGDVKIVYAPEIAVEFFVAVAFAGDAFGADLTGHIRLLGAADAKGKQKVLSKGGFAGRFSTDDVGEMCLAGLDASGATQSKGDILIIMEPAEFEKLSGGADQPPPVLLESRGQCRFGKCFCDPGFAGSNCDKNGGISTQIGFRLSAPALHF